MGGNALPDGLTRRYTADEYHALLPRVLGKLVGAFPGARVAAIDAYRTKPSFGDMDVLVESLGTPQAPDPGRALREAFSPRAIVHNGSVWSLDVEGIQLDVILASPDEFETSRVYFAWNDLGNLVGRVAHAMGFKYGHRGLLYPLRAGDTHLVKDVVVTTDYAWILAFLGYDTTAADHARVVRGFDTLEEMYAFAAGSRYFDPDYYLLHNRNHVSRTRDRKRPSYTGFLSWLEATNAKPGPDATSARDRQLHLERAARTNPGFSDRLDAAIAAHHQQLRARRAFNGDRVSALTGLTGQELGAFMAACRHGYPGGATAFTAWTAAATEEEVDQYVRKRLERIEGDTEVDDPAGMSQIGAGRTVTGVQPSPAVAPSEVDGRRP